MFTRLVLYPYNMGSQSAKNLASTLGARRVFSNGKYKWFPKHMVINWGSTLVPQWEKLGTKFLNNPRAVENASSKIKTLQILKSKNLPCPEFVTTRADAAKLFEKNIYTGFKHMVVCRTLTRANSGRGITIATTPSELVDAPLYTRYVPKQDEFRVHVAPKFGVFDIQEKRKRKDTEKEAEPYIRNHEQGWVFCREDVDCPDSVRILATNAVEALGLDFGAVDIGYHEKFGGVVYEVNTAPGLEGKTLENYVELFKKFFVQA